ncbi:MAG TPA: LCP family protein [Methylomirabilota bacterium]|nr:LCP family protein [Methylomirabilota bacterium]
MSTPSVSAPTRRGRSPYTAGFLSFLWPGLGQWYAGRNRTAALFALPVVGIALVLLLQAVGSFGQLVSLIVTPSSALTVLILIGLLAAWRLLAIADAMSIGDVKAPLRHRPTVVTFSALALVVVLMHGALGYVAWAAYDSTSRIFVGDGSPDGSPAPSLVAGASLDPDAEYEASPINTPENADARINILLTGIDAASNRTNELTDTLLIVSVDPTTGQIAMISFPRDITHFPRYDGGTFDGKINSFMSNARKHPDEFPDGPLTSLVRQMSFLLGAPIHYYAAIDLAGFRRMIDLVGGVTVDNQRAINDPRYDWLDGTHGFKLAPGKHHLNGRTALAYVRSRQGAGDNDFNRARRQQQVLLALREQLTKPENLTHIPDVLDAAGDTIRTNFPSERVGEMIDLAQRIDTTTVRQVVLGPRKYADVPPASETGGIYELRLKMDAIAAFSIEIFGKSSRYYAASN